MKGSLTKFGVSLFCFCSLLSANENITRSLQEKSLPVKQKPIINLDKDTLLRLQNKAIEDVGNNLNIDTSLFDSKKKFSLYLKVSSNSKFGFKYKF